MKKKTFKWHGKQYYLLGVRNKEKVFLEAATWDCDWYWGIGYVETFSNNTTPEKSRDITSHTHFNWLFKSWKDYLQFFDETPYTESELWKIYEIMESLYTARKYSDMLHIGGSHITSNPAADTIKNEAEYKRINETVIPSMLDKLERIMQPEGVD